MVFDVAWGFDQGEDVAHITSNASPGPSSADERGFPSGSDFFHADTIAKIEDAETDIVLFDLDGSR